MNESELLRLLNLVAEQKISTDEAVRQIKHGPFRIGHLEDSTIDHHRLLRHGLCEVVYGESKTSDQIISIAEELTGGDYPVLVTRISETKAEALQKRYPAGKSNPISRTFLLNPPEPIPPDPPNSYVAIVSAGTSDRPVVEEAADVCLASEVPYKILNDVGVAGIHRLYDKLEDLEQASAIVVVAGMEGALPSVIAGMIGKPIFAVPTSVGYGTHLNGFAPLLTMLNSCSSGVTVVNIDNGFSAAFSACKVIHEIQRALREKTDSDA